MARWKASSENILFQATPTEKNSEPDLIFFYIRMMRVAGGGEAGAGASSAVRAAARSQQSHST